MKSQSPHFPDCFYRVSVKGAYVKEGKILLVKESAETLSGKWELPGGGIDFGETPNEALKREIKEEMGLEVRSIADSPLYVWTNYRDNNRGLNWFYTCVLVYPFELVDLNFTTTDECEEVDLFTVEQLQNLDIHAQSEKIKTNFNPADFSS